MSSLSSNNAPLHFACESRSVTCTKFLLNSGAKVDVFNDRDMSPLMLAFEQRSEGIVGLLLLYGADPTKVFFFFFFSFFFFLSFLPSPPLFPFFFFILIPPSLSVPPLKCALYFYEIFIKKMGESVETRR